MKSGKLQIQIQHTPSPEVIEEVLPRLYSSAPRILNFMLEDLQSEKKEFIYSYQKSWLPFQSVNNTIISFWNYRLIKLGERFILNCEGHQNHGHVFVVKSKKNWCVIASTVADEGKTILKIPAKFIQFLEEDYDSTIIDFSKTDFEVGDFCFIKSEQYRPRYGRYSQFKIIWKGSKYVKVEPSYPRYKTWNRKSSDDIGSKVNEFTYEISTSEKTGREFYFATSVYTQFIPFSEIELIKLKHGEEYHEMIKLLDQLGI